MPKIQRDGRLSFFNSKDKEKHFLMPTTFHNLNEKKDEPTLSSPQSQAVRMFLDALVNSSCFAPHFSNKIISPNVCAIHNFQGNEERAIGLSPLNVSRSVRFPMLSQIKSQIPLASEPKYLKFS